MILWDCQTATFLTLEFENRFFLNSVFLFIYQDFLLSCTIFRVFFYLDFFFFAQLQQDSMREGFSPLHRSGLPDRVQVAYFKHDVKNWLCNKFVFKAKEISKFTGYKIPLR